MFSGLFYKSEQIAIEQSHIINPSLTSFARSVRESIAFGFYPTDLAPSSLGLYVQTTHSVNKSLVSTNNGTVRDKMIYLNNLHMFTTFVNATSVIFRPKGFKPSRNMYVTHLKLAKKGLTVRD